MADRFPRGVAEFKVNCKGFLFRDWYCVRLYYRRSFKLVRKYVSDASLPAAPDKLLQELRPSFPHRDAMPQVDGANNVGASILVGTWASAR